VTPVSLADILTGAVPVALALHREFRGITVREAVLIEGPSGWGEFAPFDDYSDAAAARWLDCAVEAAFGVWPAPVRSTVPVNAIVPAVGPDEAGRLTRTAVVERGCSTIKVKVGSVDPEQDEARVASVREALTSILGAGRGSIRIDANAAWDVESGTVALRRLVPLGIEYVEQPCRTREEMAELRRRVDVPFAVDELIRQADQPVLRVSDVADVAVLKVAPLGGVEATLRIAEALDVPVVISGSLDSSVGLQAGIAAAAALDDLPLACGLGTGELFAQDVCAPILPSSGEVPVLRRAADPEALEAARRRVSADRVEYWHQRIAAAWAVKG
jgi:O-succinylbenzoate synthase